MHINVCSGDSKYKCYVCGKKFDDDVTCSDHIKTAQANYFVKIVKWNSDIGKCY